MSRTTSSEMLRCWNCVLLFSANAKIWWNMEFLRDQSIYMCSQLGNITLATGQPPASLGLWLWLISQYFSQFFTFISGQAQCKKRLPNTFPMIPNAINVTVCYSYLADSCVEGNHFDILCDLQLFSEANRASLCYLWVFMSIHGCSFGFTFLESVVWKDSAVHPEDHRLRAVAYKFQSLKGRKYCS